LRAVGPIARQLGDSSELFLELPATLVEVLEAAAHSVPEAGTWLVRAGEPVPAVYRNGARVGAHDLVRAGDQLDLVLALPGG
jgi:hypothetical protein